VLPPVPAAAPQTTGGGSKALAATPAPNYLGYISYYWGDKTKWTINCGAPVYFPPNTCLPVNASGATQLGGPALAVNEFVAINADPATASGNGITALSFTTSTTPFPGSPLPPGYTGPTPAPTASTGPTAGPTSPATPPSTNFLGYISYYWGDNTNWTINCGAPFYFPPNTCLRVSAAGATQSAGPALAVNEFVAIYADPATAKSSGITALVFATSLTPFAGSPLPPGYTGPTPAPTTGPTASPKPTASPVPTGGPTSPATPPSTNFLGYISYYWGDPKSWTINCGGATYYPPNTCLPVNAASATQAGGPALAVNEFVAIYANPATAGANGITAIAFATSLTPFAGSPLPPGYTGPTPTPSTSPNPTPAPAFADWTTFGNNNARTGESSDTTLSASNVSSLKRVWAHQNFDFNVQTQPVVATNVPNVPYDGKTHTIVYVGGGSGRVYAYDAFTGQQLWTRALSAGTYDCTSVGGGIGPFGVQGTFAIDRANGVVYVPDGVHRIHALDLATGADDWSVNAVAPGSDDGTDSNLHEFVHTGLTLVNGKIYGGTSASCDFTPWRGRVFEIDVATRSLQSTFYSVYNSAPSGHTAGPYSGGGVWGWGGASSDGSSLYVGVGNADTSSQASPYAQAPVEWAGYAESVVRLSASLAAVDSNWPNLPSNPPDSDIDLSGTPMLFQPNGCPPLLALQGKQGYLLIYNRSNLGAGPLASFQFAQTTGEAHFIGLPAYSSKTGLLYAALPTSIGSYGPGMAILQPVNNCTAFSVVAQPSFGADSFHFGFSDPRGTATIANGVAFMGTPEGILWARDATTGAALWDSRGAWAQNNAGDQIRFGPVVTGGWVYVVATDSGSIYALSVSGAATASASRQPFAARAAEQPLPVAPIRYLAPQRNRNSFGKTPPRL
jgi:outer membrane protein assembly factor BamB